MPINEIHADLEWDWVPMTGVHDHDLPTTPGIYVITDVTRYAGFPTRVTPTYVGKTTNLRRRFHQHTDPVLSHSVDVLVKSWTSDAEFWFAKCASESLDKYERYLIRALEPMYNKVNYRG